MTNLVPTMKEGNSVFIEYWDKGGGARVRAYLEKVSIRFQGSNPLENASDPDWFVSVNAAPATKVETIYFATNDMRKWDAKVHSHLEPGDNISFTFEFIGNGADFDGGKITFWDWNGALWTATINTIFRAVGDVQPTFNLKKV